MLAWESKFTEEATKRMQSLEEAWKQREIQRNKEFELSSRRAKDAEQIERTHTNVGKSGTEVVRAKKLLNDARKNSNERTSQKRNN